MTSNARFESCCFRTVSNISIVVYVRNDAANPCNGVSVINKNKS